jgi:type III restriction enzyme
LCGPYTEPSLHWHYDRETGEATKIGQRRPARYWYKIRQSAKGQAALELQEGQDDLAFVNQIRDDVRRWRASSWEGVTPVTRELLQFWSNPERERRLFFCQLEAVETIIYLREILSTGRVPRFKPAFSPLALNGFVDPPSNPDFAPLTRLGCKMATGSGKTVVMAMLIAWAFCNHGRNKGDQRFPGAALVCCPNLTIKERLQVLRPEQPENYYSQFNMAPAKFMPFLNSGRVLVTNWHYFAPKSEHAEGDKTYAVVDKGDETPEAFARDRLGELFERMPIMVLNDEAHHCYRPKPLEAKLTGEEAWTAKADAQEATIWIEGLDRINNARADRKPGVAFCVDLSATPFYLSGSGYTEGSPFPWLVSDFGLVDAIESGIVKIPRLPAMDTTGRPEARYFRLWQSITDNLQPGEKLPGRQGKPKPEVVYREAQAALRQLAGQWKQRFDQITAATPGKDTTPPVLIIVCDNTNIAELFYRKISGETETESITPADLAASQDQPGADPEEGLDIDDEATPVDPRIGNKPAKTETVYGESDILPEFSNTALRRHTLRIDSKLLAAAESGDPAKSRDAAAEELRKIVATVGKPGQPGEQVRCVVSVAMLTEGWDANNVTNIFGVRAFGSQLLCEQVVGRGLRRMDYTPDPATGLLTEECVDVYGIPFSLVPFKGRQVDAAADDRPKNYVRSLPERAELEIRFPVVESYAFALNKNLIQCDVDAMEILELEPDQEPTATFVLPTMGYREGRSASAGTIPFQQQDRENYYATTHLQAIEFQIARMIVERLISGSNTRNAIFRLQSRHQLFPQVLAYVQAYTATRIEFRGCNPCELGMQKYVQRLVERFNDAIEPSGDRGEPPLIPILNSHTPFGSSSGVDFKTVKPCQATRKSHVNQVVLDASVWEASAAFQLELHAIAYVKNDHLEFSIPYEFQGQKHAYLPDFIAKLAQDRFAIIEIKGQEDEQDRAKYAAATRWISAVNNWGQMGHWEFIVCKDPPALGKQLETTGETHHARPRAQTTDGVSSGTRSAG